MKTPRATLVAKVILLVGGTVAIWVVIGMLSDQVNKVVAVAQIAAVIVLAFAAMAAEESAASARDTANIMRANLEEVRLQRIQEQERHQLSIRPEFSLAGTTEPRPGSKHFVLTIRNAGNGDARNVWAAIIQTASRDVQQLSNHVPKQPQGAVSGKPVDCPRGEQLAPSLADDWAIGRSYKVMVWFQDILGTGYVQGWSYCLDREEHGNWHMTEEPEKHIRVQKAEYPSGVL